MTILSATLAPKLFLFDVLLFAVAALVFGVLFYQLVAKKTSVTPWRFERIDSSAMQWQDFAAHSGLLLFFCILTGYSLLSEGNATTESVAKLSDASLIIMMLANSFIIYGVPIILFWLMLLPRANPLEVFGMKNPNYGKIACYSIFGIITCFFFLLILSASHYQQFFESIFGVTERQDAVKMMQSTMGNGLKVTTIFSAVILAPIFEELIFRGFLYTSMKKHTGAIFSILMSALFFSLVHKGPFELLPLFLLGIIFAVIYELSGSILTCITVHMLFNLINTINLLNPQQPN